MSGLAAREKPIMATDVGSMSSENHAARTPKDRSAVHATDTTASSAASADGRRAANSLTPNRRMEIPAAQ